MPYIITTFVVSLLLSFPVVVLLAMGNNRASRRRVFAFVRGWCTFWLWLTGMPVKVSGIPPAQQHGIVVANHISYLDTLVIFPAVGRYFRPLGKIEVAKVPVLGFIYRQLVILVDRSNASSRSASMRRMQKTLEREGSIVVFPEGGFNEDGVWLKPFYDGAFRLAIATGAPVFPLILPDTVQRWHFSRWYRWWPGRNRAIFLAPVYPEGHTVNTLKLAVHHIMEQALKKYAGDSYIKGT